VAAELNQQGYAHAKALLGGVVAWQQAGFPVVSANPYERLALNSPARQEE